MKSGVFNSKLKEWCYIFRKERRLFANFSVIISIFEADYKPEES